MNDNHGDTLFLAFARANASEINETTHAKLMMRLRSFEQRRRATTPAHGTIDSSSMIRLASQSDTEEECPDTESCQRTWALKFLSGKYEGGFFPLQEGQEILIGRESTLDMVLVDDLISRRHARLTTFQGRVEIEDFGSTNGTYVNGESVEKVILEEGDHLMIGTSIMLLTQDHEASENPSDFKLTPLEGMPAITSPQEIDPKVADAMQAQMTGQLQELPLPDLLQLLSATRKSGALHLEKSPELHGVMYLREGRIIHATHGGCDPLKSCYRMVAWEEGNFSLTTIEDFSSIPRSVDESVDAILMEGMRRLDELRATPGHLPLHMCVAHASFIAAPLHTLSDEELDVFEWALCHSRVSAILECSPHADYETMRILLSLMQRGYLEECTGTDTF